MSEKSTDFPSVSGNLRQMLYEGRLHDFETTIRAHPEYAVLEQGLLIKAVSLNSKEFVDVLLNHGANPNPNSDSLFATGKSLLLMAIGFGNFEIARSLLAAGADPYRGFQGAPDYGIYLASYASSGPLTRGEYDSMIEGIREGNNPASKNIA